MINRINWANRNQARKYIILAHGKVYLVPCRAESPCENCTNNEKMCEEIYSATAQFFKNREYMSLNDSGQATEALKEALCKNHQIMCFRDNVIYGLSDDKPAKDNERQFMQKLKNCPAGPEY
ncbi:hypothetical protein L596_021336 [Steinernema carpocapsae]|uniref:Uncharacterized protein n=1 Tax=Steinernema carpocapsae TaxID=34508 RepID=A0A4V5ZZV9_STECR|nr:hypothetical protein L596_021336 [Steinernema carpocapsae]